MSTRTDLMMTSARPRDINAGIRALLSKSTMKCLMRRGHVITGVVLVGGQVGLGLGNKFWVQLNGEKSERLHSVADVMQLSMSTTVKRRTKARKPSYPSLETFDFAEVEARIVAADALSPSLGARMQAEIRATIRDLKNARSDEEIDLRFVVDRCIRDLTAALPPKPEKKL